jgi:MinD-like ATPase involved in chromosome partitioning or flagellar assembly
MTGVVVAVSSQAEDAIAAAIAAHPELTLVRRCADLAEALAAASAGVAGVAVVSPQRHLDRVTLGELAHMRVRVVGVAADDREARALAALGLAAVRADDPLAVAEAAATAPDDAIELEPPEPAGPTGRLVAVWGPTGAPGRTSVAVNLAASLARSGPTLLVDLDTYGAAVSQTLALRDDAPGIAAVARAAAQGEADAATVRRHAVRAAENLSVLTGLPRPGRWAEIPAAALEAAFPAMRAAATVTVLDCGFGLTVAESASRRDAATMSALAAADLIVAVGTAEPVGMQRLVDALGDLGEAMPGVKDKMIVTVNRVRRSVAGPNPERQVADALARYAGVGQAWMIPWDPRSADLAALRGATWREVAARGAATQAVGRLADAVAAALLGADVGDTPARSSEAEPALTD